MENIQASPVYGTFNVTTEGDSEGRSTRKLGTFTGYLDELAFALADKCMYSLEFTRHVPSELDMTPKRDSVNVRLSYDSETWDIPAAERVKYFEGLLKDRNVGVCPGTNYGCCLLTKHKETDEEKKAKALGKLTPDERKLLGLE